MMRHLTSEQIESTLSGRASQEVSSHLESCAQCAGEVVSLREVFGDLREATAASAEHHRRFVSTAGARRVPRMAWAFVSAALFIAAATPVAVHYRSANHVVARPAPDAAVTISDEALLDGVQDDLSTSVPASLQPLAGTSTDTTKSTEAQRKNP
jgi:hypothetical protein